MKTFILTVLLFLFSNGLFAFAKAEFLDLPNKKTDFYGGDFSPLLLEKIRVFEGNAAEYLTNYDIISTISTSGDNNIVHFLEQTSTSDLPAYSNHILTNEEKSLLLEYFSYLPPKLQLCFTENVYAVYFVDGINYGGLTDFIFDENQKMYCVLYFNADIFNKTISQWLEYRDNTIFTETDENNKIKTQCSDDYKALLVTLIHETAHVYDLINQITPYMDFWDLAGWEKSDSDFYKVWADYNHPVKEYNHKDLEGFSYYYFGNQIPLKKAKSLLKYLEKTPFSTLYGAKNFQDDFAETLTFYYLRKTFGINYKITYIKNGKEKASYDLAKNENTRIWDSLCKEIVEK